MADPSTGSGQAQTAPPAFAASLPEAIRGEAAFKDVKDIGDLAARYLAASKTSTSAQPKVFAEMLPEKIRGEAAFKDFKSVEDLAQSYLGQGRLLGVPKDRLLTLPATPEDAEGWKAVHLKLGMPEKPEGYQLSKPTLPEGLKLDEKLQGSFTKAAHELGISNKQADGLFKWWNAAMGEQHTALTTADKTALANAGTALRGEWGQAYDDRIALAKGAINHYSSELKLGDGVMAEIDKFGIGNLPGMAKIFAHVGEQLREDGLIGRADQSGNVMAPAEAEQQIAAKFADKDFMARYRSKAASGHKEAVEQLQRLYQFASGTAGAG